MCCRVASEPVVRVLRGMKAGLVVLASGPWTFRNTTKTLLGEIPPLNKDQSKSSSSSSNPARHHSRSLAMLVRAGITVGSSPWVDGQFARSAPAISLLQPVGRWAVCSQCSSHLLAAPAPLVPWPWCSLTPASCLQRVFLQHLVWSVFIIFSTLFWGSLVPMPPCPAQTLLPGSCRQGCRIQLWAALRSIPWQQLGLQEKGKPSQESGFNRFPAFLWCPISVTEPRTIALL